MKIDEMPIRVYLRCRQCNKVVGHVRDSPWGPILEAHRARLPRPAEHAEEQKEFDALPPAARARLEAIAMAEWAEEDAAGGTTAFMPLFKVDHVLGSMHVTKDETNPRDGYVERVQPACRTHGELELDQAVRDRIIVAHESLAHGAVTAEMLDPIAPAR